MGNQPVNSNFSRRGVVGGISAAFTFGVVSGPLQANGDGPNIVIKIDPNLSSGQGQGNEMSQETFSRMSRAKARRHVTSGDTDVVGFSSAMSKHLFTMAGANPSRTRSLFNGMRGLSRTGQRTTRLREEIVEAKKIVAKNPGSSSAKNYLKCLEYWVVRPRDGLR